MKRLFRIALNASIVLVYLVIIAGAVVRMTGSGMGCPDWPKCFGYMIPPTEASQLQWQPKHQYKKGQVIIHNEALRVVKKDFTTRDIYNETNWKPYLKHDYATFNSVHTWVEYINRLATVLFGIPILLLVFTSLFLFKEHKSYFFLSLATLFSVGFEAWLGKIVVDTNLQPVRITLHVLFVFFIVAFLLWLKSIENKKKGNLHQSFLFKFGLIVILATLIQVVLGTQVRQYVDDKMTLFDYSNQKEWLKTPPFIFYIHRSFSIFILLINGIWLYRFKQHFGNLGIAKWIGILLGMEILTGILLYYLDFPFLSQPLHLLLGSLLFSIQFYIVLILSKSKSTNNI